jgi:transposase
MRKGFDGLSGLVRDGLLKDPLSGDVFIFFNKRRSQVKLLLWEGDGFSVYHKRLEQGSYEQPSATSAELKNDELMLILQGISLKSVRKRKRFDMSNLAYRQAGNNLQTSLQNSFINR